ncbi:DUF2363 domain-containing protein [Chloropicon primus]|uniref:CCR4-NOT transcription complex subunit 11 n=2 Tax=Chloropicon primus TaxID=1764295 RepID=A0A5B8MIS9_9CHLO|nr:DUF2363 domain-containing protein [Chloropicon primus]UPQ98489.1 DUF2363 domain-containing protein [Chloropicon primus]|eukprot:QDZ19280.1 DUF2363 domain-containing protein [Chloropicon primus]
MQAGLLKPVEGDRLLNDVLGGRSTEAALRDTAGAFLACFPRQDRFRACNALSLLLRDDLAGLLGGPQRVAAYFILSIVHCENKQPETSYLYHNPFYRLLAKLVLSKDTPAVERAAIHRILVSGYTNEIQSATPVALLDYSARSAPAITACDPAKLSSSITFEPEPGVRFWRDIGNKGAKRAGNFSNASSQHARSAPGGRSLEAPGGREVPWNLSSETIEEALRAPLLPSRQQDLISRIKAQPHSDPQFTRELCGFDSTCLPLLVENNPPVAVELLRKVLGAGQLQDLMLEYFAALVGMEMSVHAMEVFKALICDSSIPTDITNLYITNCIAKCHGVKDTYMQNRLVRLLSVFLQSLVRSKSAQLRDMVIEIQSFCIEFSRVKEAATLFRMLKTIEQA